MAVVARALRLLQLASQPWLRFLVAAAALYSWPKAQSNFVLLLACFVSAPHQAYEQLQEYIGFDELAYRLLVHGFGLTGWKLHLAIVAVYRACHFTMDAARDPWASYGTKLVGFFSYLLCTAAYWLPAGHTCFVVGAAMLRCTSPAQLPAALLSPAVLPQVALLMLACQRWMARAVVDLLWLGAPGQMAESMARTVAACDGRFGDWLPDTCRLALYIFGHEVPSQPYPVPCAAVILEAVAVMLAGKALPTPYLIIAPPDAAGRRLVEAASLLASAPCYACVGIACFPVSYLLVMLPLVLAMLITDWGAVQYGVPRPPARTESLASLFLSVLRPLYQPAPVAAPEAQPGTAQQPPQQGAAAGGSRRRRHACANCGAAQRPDGGRLRKCARCQLARYCSQECMAAHWPTHRGECAAA